MQDINNYIKENDTDNVTLNKLKDLGTKLTGQDNVQGETVAEVLDFINNNYSGGGSGSKTIIYLNSKIGEPYAYKDIEFTQKFSNEELLNAFINGALIRENDEDRYYAPVNCVVYDGICAIAMSDNTTLFSSEYTQS